MRTILKYDNLKLASTYVLTPMFPIEFSVLGMQIFMIEVGLSFCFVLFCFQFTPPPDFIPPLLTEFSHPFTSIYAVNLLRYKTFENVYVSVVTFCVV